VRIGLTAGDAGGTGGYTAKLYGYGLKVGNLIPRLHPQ
jgi:hypothetical protein